MAWQSGTTGAPGSIIRRQYAAAPELREIADAVKNTRGVVNNVAGMWRHFDDVGSVQRQGLNAVFVAVGGADTVSDLATVSMRYRIRNVGATACVHGGGITVTETDAAPAAADGIAATTAAIARSQSTFRVSELGETRRPVRHQRRTWYIRHQTTPSQ